MKKRRRHKRLEEERGKCGICGREIDSAVLIIKAKVTKRTFETSRVVEILCSRCWNDKYAREARQT